MTGTPYKKRDFYRYFIDIQTRWMDNDLYGHVNNVVYYSYFDTIINKYLIDEGFLDIQCGPIIGVTAETKCQFLEPVSYPNELQAGLNAEKIGRSSVKYNVGIFRKNQNSASAFGYFVHVFVSRDKNKPVSIPPSIKTALKKIVIKKIEKF